MNLLIVLSNRPDLLSENYKLFFFMILSNIKITLFFSINLLKIDKI